MNPSLPNNLSSLGAIGGIAYGISLKKGFWVTACLGLLFAVGGAAVGTTYNYLKTNKK
jgi:hypothetical protein